MTPEPVCHANRKLEIHRGFRSQLTKCRFLQCLFDRLNFEIPVSTLYDRQAHTVYRDAVIDVKFLRGSGSRDREVNTTAHPSGLSYRSDLSNDAGKHIFPSDFANAEQNVPSHPANSW